MAVYKISDRLQNAVPVLEVAEGETYEVNDNMRVAVEVQEIFNSGDDAFFAKIEEIFKKLIGEAGAERLKKNHPDYLERISTAKVLLIGCMAAISGETLEEVEARFLDE